MKVLLIFPPGEIPRRNIKNINPPMGIAYLGATLKKAGNAVTLLDCQIEGFKNETALGGGRVRFGLSPGRIAESIEEAAPDVVGISCLFTQMTGQAKEVARIVKQVRPDAVTLMGGLHPTLYTRDALEEPAVDFAFRGQGDRALPEFMEVLSSDGDPASVPGVSVRGMDEDDAGTCEPAVFLEELDELPFPAWPLLPMESYFSVNLPHGIQVRTKRGMPVLTSRGCPYQCGFCTVALAWKRRIAFRSPENVISEIELLIKEYGIQEIHFEDDNLTVNRDRAMKLFRLMVRRTPRLVWNVPGGIAPWTLDDELLEAMARSGCYEVNLSIESGSVRVLTEVMGKPNFLAEIPRIVATCKRLGIFVSGYYMIGFPSETMKEVQQTLRAPIRFGFSDAYFNIWFPVPGTRLYREAVEQGVLLAGDITFSDFHISARIPRRKGVPLPMLERVIARATWHVKLRLLIRNPVVFFFRYVQVILRNPGVLLRFVLTQIRLATIR